MRSLSLTISFFGVAVLVHVVAFSIFVVRFPRGAVYAKPQMIFIGAILQSQDLISPARRQRPDQIDINVKTLQTGHINPEAQWLGARRPRKPYLGRGLLESVKTTLSVNAEDTSSADTVDVPSVEDLGVDPQGPVYSPLKLYNP